VAETLDLGTLKERVRFTFNLRTGGVDFLYPSCPAISIRRELAPRVNIV
jgi:hypothetical protein